MTRKVRTRYAPSPTGFMHVGNLRTALYEYLIAKSQGGTFVLRIEDTDQERYVEGAVDVIYNTLKTAGLKHDEGPDIGGDYGPYVQSERKDMYLPFAEKLIENGKAYRCFCSKERLEALRNTEEFAQGGYDRHCRDLPQEEIDKLLAEGVPYVIRQKMPLDGETTFTDSVFGEITAPNSELQDQILIKTDGYPTYNFANVIDDHTMGITHVVRGNEYLSSTPKYNLLYEAFGWEIPTYVHLPLIMGQNDDGTTSKLSKRHGSTGFEDLIKDGFLPQAIINYIASVQEFEQAARPYILQAIGDKPFDTLKIAAILQQRTTKLTQIPAVIDFFAQQPEYSKDLFVNKKSKTNFENAPIMLKAVYDELSVLEQWNHDILHDTLINLAVKLGVKNGTVMWPARIAVSGKAVTPGGAVEILDILGKKESLKRMEQGLQKLS